MQRVIIIGGGFGGLSAAKQLGNAKDIEVVLLDKRNHHLFQPLLYQVAMAGLSPADIAAPIRSILGEYKNVSVYQREVSRIDRNTHTVYCEGAIFQYDYLILACGALHTYFGHPEWEIHAPGLKSLEGATEIRRRVLSAFEMAENEPDPEKQKALLTFVIIGGGPTGVELAGALAELTRHSLSKEFRKIDPVQAKIILVEAGPAILDSFSDALSEYAKKALESLGVEIWFNKRATHISAEGVVIGDEKIPAKTVLWAAGVAVSSVSKTLDAELDRAGRVTVQKDMSLPSDPKVFVIGDMANAKDESGNALPGVAPVAMQEGRYVAKLIKDELKGRARVAFHYVNKGNLATIGRNRAILDYKTFELSGFLAWIVWIVVHVYYLIGFRSRILVLLQWAWSYFTYRKGARLIVGKEWRIYED